MIGKELDTDNVLEARSEEVESIHTSKLYNQVPRPKAKGLGAKVVSARWVEINTGDTKCQNCRSRLVAREIKRANIPDLFAAIPARGHESVTVHAVVQ